MEEESLKHLTNSIIFLVKLFAGLKDKFLAQKLYDKISGLIAGYIKLFHFKAEDTEASHNVLFVELKNTTNSLLELLDYLEHSKLSSTTPLLYARRNLLDFKLSLVRLQNQSIQLEPKPKENKPIPAVPVFKNIQPRSPKESSNKDKIFNFIKRYLII